MDFTHMLVPIKTKFLLCIHINSDSPEEEISRLLFSE